VQLEPDLEGLLHISELSDQKIKRPQDVVKVDDELEVKILKVDNEARKIGLSLRRAQWAAEGQAPEGQAGEVADAVIADIEQPAEAAQPEGAPAQEQSATDEPGPEEPTI
jgi:small subunit ribosomal protein S1